MISCSRKLRRPRFIDFGPLHPEFDLLNSFSVHLHSPPDSLVTLVVHPLCPLFFLHLLYMLIYLLPTYLPNCCLTGVPTPSFFWRGAFFNLYIYTLSFFCFLALHVWYFLCCFFHLFGISSILAMWRKRDTKKDDGGWKGMLFLKSTRLIGLSTPEAVDLVW